MAKSPSGFFTILAIIYVHWSCHQPRVSVWFPQIGKSAQFLHIKSKSDSISSASASTTCAHQRLRGLCISKSPREQGALATNWIKERPEGLKLQNLALTTKTGPFCKQFTGKSNCRRPLHTINKCETLGSGKQLVLHGNPSAIARDFSPHMAVIRRHFLPNVHFQCCMSLQGTSVTILRSLRPAANPLGAPLEKPVQDQLA